MKKSEAAKLVSVALVAYPAQGGKLSEAQQLQLVDVFADLLGDLTYEQCSAALRVLVQTKQWMPTVAEIRATVLELATGPGSAGGDAWGQVLKAIHRYGAWRAPGSDFQFDDPITARCVESFGWRELCLSENATADRARFVDLYDKLAGDSRRQQQAPALAAGGKPNALTGEVGKLIALVAKVDP